MIFPRSTQRTLFQKKVKLRHKIDSDLTDNDDWVSDAPSINQGMARDFLFVDTQDYKFIITLVPKQFGPSWSHSLCIEYRREWGIPDEEIRIAIKEFSSFILGANFISVGYSSFDKSDNYYELSFYNPNVLHPPYSCNHMGLPPVAIHGFTQSSPIEALFNSLLPTYIELRNKLNLDDVIRKFFVAHETYVGVNLPILSNALEVLAQAIVKLNLNQSPGNYISSKDYLSLIGDEIESISNKIKDVEGSTIIVNKIKGACHLGTNDKMRLMFELLNLKIDKVEKDALKMRNKMAHSTSSKMSDEDSFELIKMTRAYETLFNRIILKTLGYKGNYVDYYTLGYPERNIDTPIPI